MYIIVGDIKKYKYLKASGKRNISAEMNKNTINFPNIPRLICPDTEWRLHSHRKLTEYKGRLRSHPVQLLRY